jgi:hypothetical protein
MLFLLWGMALIDTHMYIDVTLLPTDVENGVMYVLRWQLILMLKFLKRGDTIEILTKVRAQS